MSPNRSGNGAAGLVVAAILAGLGVTLIWFAAHTSPTPPPHPAAATNPTSMAPTAAPPTPNTTVKASATRPDRSSVPVGSARTRGGVPDPIHGLILPASEPVAVAIRRLGVESSLVHLGIDSAGAMQVPSDPNMAGWYTRGPTPGALGPAVIAGHVTWNQQPAIFFRLSELREGDRIQVTRRDGQTAVFAVVRVVRYPKTHFPTGQVFGAIDYAGLRLITCGGQYDASAHRYLANVVAFARLIAVHRTAD
jgi:Sortase domain